MHDIAVDVRVVAGETAVAIGTTADAVVVLMILVRTDLIVADNVVAARVGKVDGLGAFRVKFASTAVRIALFAPIVVVRAGMVDAVALHNDALCLWVT